MTDWLFKEDDYVPEKDKSAYLDKSILSIIGVLSRIRRGTLSGKNGYYAVFPPVKIFFTVLMILFLALSRNIHYVLIVDSVILLTASLLALKDIRNIFAVSAVVFAFSTVILLPSALTGNFSNSLMILLKIAGCVTLVNMLSHTSKMDDITLSLGMFCLPDVVILIIDLTFKYIVILGDLSVDMLLSLKLRSIGKNRRKRHSFSSLIGVLFLKSKEMSEDAYDAMQCRGFDSGYGRKLKFTVKPVDLAYVIANLSVIGLFFII
jgi:cobalt/nickel transport system permease protein